MVVPKKRRRSWGLLALHLERIRAHPPYRYRARTSLASLMVVFRVGSLVPLPRQTSDWLGLEELGVLGRECAFLMWDFRRTRGAVAHRRWGLTFSRPYQLRTTLAVGLGLVGMVRAALVGAGREAGFYLLAGFSVVTMVWVVINTCEVCFERGFLDYVNAAGDLISVDESWLPIENAALLSLKKLCANPTELMMEAQKADRPNMVAFFLRNSASIRQNLWNAVEDFNLKAPWFPIDEDHNALKQRHLTLVPKMMPDIFATLLRGVNRTIV